VKILGFSIGFGYVNTVSDREYASLQSILFSCYCEHILLFVVTSIPDVVRCCVCVRAQWVYSERARDRGDQFASDLIDIDADHEDAQLEVDGSGNEDDEDGEQSGDGEDDDASGGKY